MARPAVDLPARLGPAEQEGRGGAAARGLAQEGRVGGAVQLRRVERRMLVVHRPLDPRPGRRQQLPVGAPGRRRRHRVEQRDAEGAPVARSEGDLLGRLVVLAGGQQHVPAPPLGERRRVPYAGPRCTDPPVRRGRCPADRGRALAGGARRVAAVEAGGDVGAGGGDGVQQRPELPVQERPVVAGQGLAAAGGFGQQGRALGVEGGAVPRVPEEHRVPGPGPLGEQAQSAGDRVDGRLLVGQFGEVRGAAGPGPHHRADGGDIGQAAAQAPQGLRVGVDADEQCVRLSHDRDCGTGPPSG